MNLIVLLGYFHFVTLHVSLSVVITVTTTTTRVLLLLIMLVEHILANLSHFG